MRVFAQTVAQAAACITYSYDITHWDLRDGVHEALGGFFSFVNVFSSEPLNGAALMVNFSGFHALNTIKNQSSAEKNVRVTPEAPTEISLGASAAVSHLVLLFKCK